MKKNLILTTLLLLVCYVFAMEEREKQAIKPISPKLKTYLDKLPAELRDIINQFRIFELEQLPDELIMPVFMQLAKESKAEKAWSTA